MQKQQEIGGFGRQDSSGPHTFNLLQASTTQLLVTTRAAAAAAAAAGGAESTPAAAGNALADLTMASSSGGSSPGVLAEANAVAAELELVLTPPPASAAPDAMQASLHPPQMATAEDLFERAQLLSLCWQAACCS